MKSRRLGLLSAIAALLAVAVFIDRGLTSSPRETAPRTASELAVATATKAKPADGAENEAEPAVRNPIASLELDSLTQTIERPLFAPNRRPPVKAVRVRKKPPAPPPRAKVKRNPFKLLGVVGGGDGKIALLRDQRTGRHVRVESGDLIDGWQVEAIDTASVTIKHRQRTVVLSLSDN